MSLCALQSAAPAARWEHQASVFEFLRRYFASVDFKNIAFHHGTDNVCVPRKDKEGEDVPAMICMDPLNKNRNLVASVTVKTLGEIQAGLRDTVLLYQPTMWQSFWKNARVLYVATRCAGCGADRS